MHLRTDEEAEAAEALCMASRLADELDRDLSIWRWVIIALHSSLQGFMVLSLRHGNGLLALSDRSYAEWMEAYENEGPYPKKEKLDSYLGLYKKIKSEKIGQVGGNERFEPKGTEGRSIKKLDAIRNDFIHFTPKGWALEVDGLPSICNDCLRLIQFLGWETENIYWHNPHHRDSAQLCWRKLRDQMVKLEQVYEGFRS